MALLSTTVDVEVNL
jgi:hypothetical protein